MAYNGAAATEAAPSPPPPQPPALAATQPATCALDARGAADAPAAAVLSRFLPSAASASPRELESARRQVTTLEALTRELLSDLRAANEARRRAEEVAAQQVDAWRRRVLALEAELQELGGELDDASDSEADEVIGAAPPPEEGPRVEAEVAAQRAAPELPHLRRASKARQRRRASATLDEALRAGARSVVRSASDAALAAASLQPQPAMSAGAGAPSHHRGDVVLRFAEDEAECAMAAAEGRRPRPRETHIDLSFLASQPAAPV